MITLQFVTEANIGSWAIRLGTHSDFSHVDVVMSDGRLLGARSDTAMPGVAIRKPDYAVFTRVQRVLLPVSFADAWHEETPFYNFLRAQLGKPYDWKSIVGFVINRDWRETDSWFCSELVIAALETAGIVKVATTANRITPNDAFLLASSVA